MSTYTVTNKTTGQEVTRYSASSVQESLNDVPYPLADYDHTEFAEDAPVVVNGPLVWTKLEYLRRFTQAERIAIRTAATQVPALQDYLELLTLAEEIRSDDPDIVGALQMLEGSGLIGAGRAQGIINGQ